MADPTSALTSINAVSGAYRSSRDMVSENSGESGSFAEILARSGRDVITTIREAEATAMAGLNGTADTQAVVEATLELESTVRVAVSVRDKLVEAYQEILRMPI